MATTVAGVRRRPLPLPIGDALVGGALALAAVVATAQEPGVVHPGTEIAGALAVGTAALRTRAPLAMTALTAVAISAYATLPATGTPLWTFVGILVIAFSAGVHLDGGRLWVGTALLLLSGYFLQVVTSARSPGGLSFGDVWISPMVIIGGPMLAGVLLRRSRRQTEQLRRLTAELDGEREKHAQAAATEERNRIARELHDVISHSVSVMVVQAGAAEQLLPGNEPAREQVHAVRETGKEALAELRRQLGVLRDGQPEGSAPLPGLPELPALVQAAGARFTLEERSASPVAPGVGLAVYRVVQEALTNARRHASGAPVSVRLRHDSDGIDLVVEDEGGTGSPVGDGGNGLLGMRERVQMYGGELEAGPSRGTLGWRVHASLPLVDRDAP